MPSAADESKEEQRKLAKLERFVILVCIKDAADEGRWAKSLTAAMCLRRKLARTELPGLVRPGSHQTRSSSGSVRLR
jgi:hypothetical protein